MAKPGDTMLPSATEQELKLLQVKYSVFLEMIGLQRKWRKAVKDALA